MIKFLWIILIFSSPCLVAQESIAQVFEDSLKFHYSGGIIGAPSKVIDKAIKLVSKGNGQEARKYLITLFPFDETYIDETIQLFENANADLSNNFFSWKNLSLVSCSFTDHMIDKRHQEENCRPHTAKEIYWHLLEGIGSAFVAGECIILGSPIGAIVSSATAVHHFLEASHKYCDNISWENEQQNMYDRTHDCEVR
jgi:hypothetical protein